MKIKISNEKIVGIALLIIAAALCYNLFMLPQRKQLRAVRSHYISSKGLLKDRQVKREKIEVLKNTNREWKNKLVATENKFLQRGEIHSFLKNLAQLAEKTRNELKTVDPLERDLPPELGVERMLVKVTIIGRYASLTNFLTTLTTNEKLLGISDVEINRESRESRDLEASFVLTLFIIKPR